jgi:cytochrome c biogenesis protein CcdA
MDPRRQSSVARFSQAVRSLGPFDYAVMLAVVVFGGEAGTLMTIARQETNWAAHPYVYLAVFSLGLATLYLALTGGGQSESVQGEESDGPAKSGERAR